MASNEPVGSGIIRHPLAVTYRHALQYAGWIQTILKLYCYRDILFIVMQKLTKLEMSFTKVHFLGVSIFRKNRKLPVPCYSELFGFKISIFRKIWISLNNCKNLKA
jgi:hypothetical protein